MRKCFYLMLLLLCCSISSYASAIQSIETPYTILKVRSAKFGSQSYAIASGYDGELLCISYSGDILWELDLSNLASHDIYCRDIDNDGNDEIFVANASGKLYCVNYEGKILWSFQQNEVPLYAVTVVDTYNGMVVVTGGFDKNIYCLDTDGKMLRSYACDTFAVNKFWGDSPISANTCNANFLRTVKNNQGKELLLIHGVIHSMSTAGILYYVDLDTDEDKVNVVRTIKKFPKGSQGLGSMSVYDDSEGMSRVLMGSSTMVKDAHFFDIPTLGDDVKSFSFSSIKGKNSRGEDLLDNFGYRVIQVEGVNSGEEFYYFVLVGSRIYIMDKNFEYDKENDVLISRFSYNDLWQDRESNKMILASAQSGGNCIHIIDLDNPKWRDEYKKLLPPGNIAEIIASTNELRRHTLEFEKPEWEHSARSVYFMSENLDVKPTDSYYGKYDNAVFLGGKWTSGTENPDAWNRDTMSNEKYRLRREGRQKYLLSSQEAKDMLLSSYEFKSKYGTAYWAGHGNDPFYFAPRTLLGVLADSATFDKKTVMIMPELEDHSDDFQYVMDVLIYPLADYIENNKRDVNLYIRTKDIFWFSSIYLKAWDKVLRGEYPDVFVPSMEETSDRIMDLTIAARLGIWSSGAVESWGSRCARDNTSYDRLRQHSHQMLPNHFLRMMVYHISYGAQYIDNFPVDQNYMSILWDMIGKGLIYVPRHEEIVSFSPVSFAMEHPDEDFEREGSVNKWTALYDADRAEEMDNMVFSRMNSTWCAAGVTPWDFSSYASKVKDRRLNFLAPYPNGMVMIAPFDDKDAPRGELKDKLHPLYHDIMKRYSTDGKYFYVDGEKRTAKEYYKTVANSIETLSEKIPITVEGEVAWVAAQTDPHHIRLTLIDNGYLNPSKKMALVKFHTVKPVKILDLATGQELKYSRNNKQLEVEIPTGMFRFLDIQLSEAF